jgi:hypothetical protein
MITVRQAWLIDGWEEATGALGAEEDGQLDSLSFHPIVVMVPRCSC